MRILPYERFTIESPLPFDEATYRLRHAVAAATFSFRPPPQPFQGSVNGHTFAIRRVTSFRNSFRPHATGRIVPGHSGSVIEVTMTLAPVVKVFMVMWLTAAALIFAGFGIALLRGSRFAGEVGFFPLLFLPFGLAVCTVGYWMEAGETKHALHQLFDAVARQGKGQ